MVWKIAKVAESQAVLFLAALCNSVGSSFGRQKYFVYCPTLDEKCHMVKFYYVICCWLVGV